ncbi:unnamed protein product [Pleuronectes platessa]|uniref:Uncharacterized protein n=1 Tax=Pleuronectes platessa TaxID=8262 RepID=A0A9N7YT89_PLEPL|nr:unnamed protein product [Pleuronectes platessa]
MENHRHPSNETALMSADSSDSRTPPHLHLVQQQQHRTERRERPPLVKTCYYHHWALESCPSYVSAQLRISQETQRCETSGTRRVSISPHEAPPHPPATWTLLEAPPRLVETFGA